MSFVSSLASSSNEHAASAAVHEICRDAETIERLIEVHVRSPTVLPLSKYIEEAVTAERFQVLASWMSQVCHGSDCSADVMFSAIEILHEFLYRREVSLPRLQLAGAVALLISSKMNDTCPIPIESLCYAADGCYSAQDVKDLEMYMLAALEWRLHGAPSPVHVAGALIGLVCPELLGDAPLFAAVSDIALMCYTDLGLYGYGSVLVGAASLYVALCDTQYVAQPPPGRPIDRSFALYQKALTDLMPTLAPLLSHEKKTHLYSCLMDVQGAALGDVTARRSVDEGLAPSPNRPLQPHFVTVPFLPSTPTVGSRQPSPLPLRNVVDSDERDVAHVVPRRGPDHACVSDCVAVPDIE